MTGRTIGVGRKPRNGQRGLIAFDGLALPAALGRAGTSAFKREGDGATPIGRLRFVEGFYRADRVARPASRLPMRPIRRDDGWCDAAWHGAYNRLVRLPFPASAETMWRDDHLYDIVVVLDWNYSTRAAARGSAIFLHMARPGYEPTEGCIALRARDLKRVLAIADVSTSLLINR